MVEQSNTTRSILPIRPTTTTTDDDDERRKERRERVEIEALTTFFFVLFIEYLGPASSVVQSCGVMVQDDSKSTVTYTQYKSWDVYNIEIDEIKIAYDDDEDAA